VIAAVIPELIRKHEGHVTRLTLNRPQKANALSAALVEALIDAVEYACTDGTRLLILDAEGAHFCAGFDFTGFEQESDGDLALRFIRIETLLQALHHAPMETLVLAHGRIFGAGADIVASCGTRIATADATFRMPGLRFGVVLGTRRFADRVGADNARKILSASRAFDAAEALRIGFLSQVAQRRDWSAIVAGAAAQCELLSPAAAAALRRHTTHDTRAEDMAALARSVSTPGIKERIRAFRDARGSHALRPAQKKRPEISGRPITKGPRLSRALFV
jgi:enoyl-CoA hydratase/carnithine racemase